MTIASYLSAGLVAIGSKAGYRSLVAISAFCTTCQRTVYIEKEDTPVCPVCSSPLLETIEAEDEQDAADESVQ